LVRGVFAAGISRWTPARKRRILGASLLASTLYLLIGVGLHQMITRDLVQTLREENPQLRIERLRAYPTIFQPWLRSFVARTDQGLYTGLHSWQERDCPSWQIHRAANTTREGKDILSSWEGELLSWFADGDVGVFSAEASPGSRAETVRLEDLRYAWASAGARGMWGLEARFQDGQRAGPITRIARPSLAAADAARLLRLLLGRLPEAAGGWHRPGRCLVRTR
jgi:hypothetical protein